MKIAICDDREDDRGALKALLEAYGQDFEIREYGSGESLCKDMDYIRECGIVFLDINMDGMDGLEVARQIKAECPKVHIVLVTAYVNYALDGYKVKASRFLLKDDLEQTLQECMDDILREILQEERVMEFGFVEGNVQAAAGLAERLTESIFVEMSAVNTNHAVVNAVLNQKFHVARGQGISMIFRVGDMSGMRLDGEETVILLSNLLDNAIHECVKVAGLGRKAVINIKLVEEGGKLIFSVKNPVAKKVQVADSIVLDSGGGMHGVGLMNVKAVVDKYGGDFAISCDQEKFQAVVML